MQSQTQEPSGTSIFESVQDLGARRSFETGSVRDTQAGKPRIDLIPPLWIKRLGVHLANGAVKYGDSNWQKGQPISQYYTSGMRHMMAWFEGQEDEDHFAAAAWNTLAAMWTLDEVKAGRLPGYLDDRLVYFELARAEAMRPTEVEPGFVPTATEWAKCSKCGKCCCIGCYRTGRVNSCVCDQPTTEG